MDKLLSNNSVVKIVALFLAIALWFVVNGGETSTAPQYNKAVETYRISEVSLSSKVNKDRLAIVKIPETVTVELKGTPAALSKNISPTDYQVYVDLTSYNKGSWVVPVQYSGFPSDLSVRIIPEKIEVILEAKQSVEKEVKPRLIGEVVNGYSVGEAIVTPKKVHVMMPESRVKDIGEIQASINVEGSKEGIEQTVPLRVLDKKGNPMEAEINPAVVEVKIPVTSPYKTLPIKLGYVNNASEGVSIDSIRVITDEIMVYGPLEVIDKLTFYPGPQIDLSTIKEDRYLQLKVPLQPNIVKIEPDFVELEISVSKAEAQTFEQIPINVNGLGEGLQAVFARPENGMMPLTVTGSSKLIKDLTHEDIQLYIDVSNLPPGEHEVPILMNLPTFISAKEATEAQRALVRIEKVE